MADKRWTNLSTQQKMDLVARFLEDTSHDGIWAISLPDYDKQKPDYFPNVNTLQNQIRLLYKQIVAALGYLPITKFNEPPPLCDCGRHHISTYAIVYVGRPGMSRIDGSSKSLRDEEVVIPMCHLCLKDHQELEEIHEERLANESRGADKPKDEWADPQGFLYDIEPSGGAQSKLMMGNRRASP